MLAQLAEVYANSSLLRRALDEADRQWRGEEDARRDRVSVLRAERSDLEHRLNRYLVAFEEGTLRPETAQTRIEAIEERITAISSEEADVSGDVTPEDWKAVDLDLASALLGVSLSAILSEELPPERSKALLRQLIEEIRVVSAQDVRVTYRVPPEVRLPDGMVEMRVSEFTT